MKRTLVLVVLALSMTGCNFDWQEVVDGAGRGLEYHPTATTTVYQRSIVPERYNSTTTTTTRLHCRDYAWGTECTQQ